MTMWYQNNCLINCYSEQERKNIPRLIMKPQIIQNTLTFCIYNSVPYQGITLRHQYEDIDRDYLEL